MKSKILSCNWTVIKKDIIWLCPLWVIEFILLQLLSNISLSFSLANTFHDKMLPYHQKVAEAQDAMAGLLIGEDNVFITAAVSITTAILVFGYLYRKVSAYATHSLPLSRTVLFCSHFAAGFLIITVPYLLTFLVTGIINIVYGLGMGTAVFAAFLRVLIMILFFYSLSCAVTMVSGSSGMSILIYGVLNILACGFSTLFWAVMETTCYGMNTVSLFDIIEGPVAYLTPIYHFIRASKFSGFYFLRSYESVEDMESLGSLLLKSPWNRFGQYVWYLLPALLFCAAAWFLYQRRPLENTGDVMAFPWSKAVFRIVFSICGSMLFTIIFWMVSSEFLAHIVTYRTAYVMAIILLLFFSGISFLISEMLLAKTFMVWKKIALRQMGIICIVMPIFFIICHMAYQNNSMLDTKNIEKMSLSFCGITYVYDTGEFPERLEELQKEILSGGNKETIYDDYQGQGDYARFYMEYTTKKGDTESRSYKITLEEQAELSSKIQEFFNRQDNKIDKIFPPYYNAESIGEVLLEKGYESSADGKEWSKDELSMVFTAIQEDLKDGNIIAADIEAYKDPEHSRSVTLWFHPVSGFKDYWEHSFDAQEFFITDKCIHTLEALQKLEIEF